MSVTDTKDITADTPRQQPVHQRSRKPAGPIADGRLLRTSPPRSHERWHFLLACRLLLRLVSPHTRAHHAVPEFVNQGLDGSGLSIGTAQQWRNKQNERNHTSNTNFPASVTSSSPSCLSSASDSAQVKQSRHGLVLAEIPEKKWHYKLIPLDLVAFQESLLKSILRHARPGLALLSHGSVIDSIVICERAAKSL